MGLILTSSHLKDKAYYIELVTAHTLFVVIYDDLLIRRSLWVCPQDVLLSCVAFFLKK